MSTEKQLQFNAQGMTLAHDLRISGASYNCTNKLKYTFYHRWIVVNDFHIPVKKPKKALTKQKLIVVAVIFTMISLFTTFFHYRVSLKLRNNYNSPEKVAVLIKCTDFNMTAQEKRIRKLESDENF